MTENLAFFTSMGQFGRTTWTAFRENFGLMHKSEQQLFRLGASV